MTYITKIWLGAVAVLVSTLWLAAVVLVPAAAAAGELHSITVKFADLDLNRAADVKVLYRRINLAAEDACGEKELTGSHVVLPSWRRCVELAIDQAVVQLDRPALNAYHQQLTADSARKG
jgi:UrcA family protein